MQEKKFHFGCQKCGAKLYYSADEGELKCSYCSHINTIQREFKKVIERDYLTTLSMLKKQERKKVEIEATKCNSCGATFELSKDTHASTCPYCSSPIVNETSLYRVIEPQAILPFKVQREEARAVFKKWINGLWFAPNSLKNITKAQNKLKAIYIPYWTYDSDTYSRYRGRRGEKYYVTERYSVVVNGQHQSRTRQVERIEWYAVSGDLNKHFDDVVVPATDSLQHTPKNWDLENLVDYDPSYISGYESEYYTIDLPEGLVDAKRDMEVGIRVSIKRQIGGDLQEITTLETHHSNITYKHILLPLYASAFKFNNKVYSYVINARNAEIDGDRPYSVVKITFAVAFALLVVSGGVYLYEHPELIS